EAVKSLRLDRLIVMPVSAPPHKKGKALSPDNDRLKACEIAFAHLPQAEVSDFEIESGGVSYTYLTCRHFRTLYSNAEIFWLVGTDMLRDFPTWKQPESILNDVTLAVCARDEKDGWLHAERAKFYERFGKDFAVVPYNGKPVSSTKIRVLAGAGEDISAFVPQGVAAYIKARGLYEIAGAKEALALEKTSRKAHTLRVAEVAAKKAVEMGISERKAITAALFHDCGKNLGTDSPLLKDFRVLPAWGQVPPSVLHQFTGAYLAENAFGVKDEDILNAVRYHTSGRAGMSELEKLIFLADMVEEERAYDGVDGIRALFWAKKGEGALDECLERALKETIAYLKNKGDSVYPLTMEAIQRS
ncbi:MAG: nicotinate (nicotinamide) nucleotide adenylyltransferase, partial [Clostridia bacterium]|nr:nicotinate (nicotinamide) nucleotide adenylyltransferase [Clostridia bacterium]